MKKDGYIVMELTYEEKDLLESEYFYLETLGEGGLNGTLEFGVMIYINFDGSAGERIKAIKRIREVTGYGLKDAKELTDVILETRRPVKVGVPLNEVQINRLKQHGFEVTGTRPKTHFDKDLFTI